MIIEYGIGFNNKGELVVIEFNRTTGKTKYISLVVVDGKVVMATEKDADIQKEFMQNWHEEDSE